MTQEALRIQTRHEKKFCTFCSGTEEFQVLKIRLKTEEPSCCLSQFIRTTTVKTTEKTLSWSQFQTWFRSRDRTTSHRVYAGSRDPPGSTETWFTLVLVCFHWTNQIRSDLKASQKNFLCWRHTRRRPITFLFDFQREKPWNFFTLWKKVTVIPSWEEQSVF